MRNATLRKMRSQWQLYLLLALPIIYLLVFCYYPMTGLQLAFRKFSVRGGIWNSQWVGLAQFTKFFNSTMFSRVLGNMLTISLYSLIAGFPVPILFALLLNSMRNNRMRKTVQTITYIPHFISTVVMVGMVMQIFSPISGIYGSLNRTLTGAIPADLLANPASARHMYVWSGVWQDFGWDSIIYVAALAGISEELHEAAEIDGAGRFQRLWHIDLPGILPTVVIMLILRFGRVMSIGFEKIYLMQNAMNLRSLEVISTYEYKVALGSAMPDFSLGTAIGMFNSVVNLILITAVNWFSRSIGETSLW